MRPATPTRRRRAIPGQWGFELYRALNLNHFPSPGSRTTMPLAKISTATGGEQQSHDPDHDVDADLPEPASDLGRRPERNPGRERDQQANATLDINFGEFPLGTASQWYGSVRYSIEGSVAGANFGISNPLDSTGAISDGIYYRGEGSFGSSGFVEGAVSGPNAEFAVVRYQSGIGSALVQGVLLLQAQ